MENTWKENLKKEVDDLSEKIEKLNNFIDSDKYNTLSYVHKELLRTQKAIMSSYLNIIVARFALLKN